MIKFKFGDLVFHWRHGWPGVVTARSDFARPDEVTVLWKDTGTICNVEPWQLRQQPDEE